MKKPRKQYRPKYVARNPMKTFFGGMSDTHAEHTLHINLRNSVAMLAIVEGRADRSHWDQLNGAVNIAAVMCDQGIGPEYRQEIEAARDAMLSLGKGYWKTGRFLFGGDQMLTMNEFIDIHEAQLLACRAIDVDRAAMEVERRVRFGINSTNVQREIERLAA